METQDRNRQPSYIRRAWDRREFAFQLALSNLRAENAGTFLGVLWWVLNPLLLGAVYYFVFGIILKTGRGEPEYLAYLLIGVFVFTYTRTAVLSAPNLLLRNARLLANIRLPRLLIPLGAVFEAFVGFTISLVALLAILVALDQLLFGMNLLIVIGALILQTVFNLGLAFLMAAIAIPVRDVIKFVPYLLRIWLYLSPIIWPISAIDDLDPVVQSIVRLNPMYSILEMYRGGLLGWEVDWVLVAGVAGLSIAVLMLSTVLFVRNESNMARHL